MSQDGGDYTLAGVMRYLQTEWQRNEREHIQWDIERAEMKSRIAKLEGDKQHLQRRSDNLQKTVDLLQRRVATSNERSLASDSGPASRAETAPPVDALPSTASSAHSTNPTNPTNPSSNAVNSASNPIGSTSAINSISAMNSTNSASIKPKAATPDPLAVGAKAAEQDSGLPTRSEIGYTKLAESREHLSKCVAEIRYLLEQSGLSPEDNSPYKDQGEKDARYGAKTRLVRTLANYASAIPAVAFLSKSMLAFGTTEGAIIVVDLDEPANAAPKHTLQVHSGSVTVLHVDEATNQLYSAGKDGKIAVHQFNEGSGGLSTVRTLGPHRAAVTSLSVSAGPKLLVSASEDGTCGVWNLDTGKEISSMQFFPASLKVVPTVVLFCPDLVGFLSPTQVVVAHNDSSLVIADATTGQLVKRLYTPTVASVLGGVSPRTTGVVGLTSPSGDKLLVTSHANGDLRIWDLKKNTIHEEIDAAHRSEITSLSLSPRGNVLLTTGQDGQVSLWSLQLGNTTWKARLLAHDSAEAGGALCSTWFGDRVAIGGGDELVRVYNMA